MSHLIKIKSITELETLRYRENAETILSYVFENQIAGQITLDWIGIKFASRSFLHELITGLSNYEVNHVNQSENVEKMIKLLYVKPKTQFKSETV